MEVEYDFYYVSFQCVPTTPPESSQQILKWFHLFNFSKAIQIQPIQQRTQFNNQAIAKIAISTVVLQFIGEKSNDTRCSTILFLLRVSWEWLWISIICRLLICMIVDGRGPVGEAWGSSLYIDHKQTFYATHDNLAAKVEHQYLPSLLAFACQ